MKAKDLKPGDFFRLDSTDDLKLCITVTPLPPVVNDPLFNCGAVTVRYAVQQDITLANDMNVQVIKLNL
jgi:hypothetical protein